ncbi:putative LRR receptor-like serine/threonine-protein kinase [Camellia lanceoleosa]|uniref:LRR receptor-like serine/threonine-protein kinase n=1 Tax=Camellia lanceoleosa TaxID=1840588 RepID=A0ACC0GKY3_9ERIC|nr:putative LRR receptor-like serine/threonine-protein kinase [Camellia lanceoleosa]
MMMKNKLQMEAHNLQKHKAAKSYNTSWAKFCRNRNTAPICRNTAICTFMLVLFILICFGACGIEAQTRRIPPDEMAALSEIAEQLGKKDWNLNLNHCDENFNWYTPIVPTSISNSTVNCNCSSADECHISAIELEASGFEGPIPSDISLLRNLTEIRITDLNGGASEFPKLENMTALEKLMLRNCNISGTIPVYLASFPLKVLYLTRNLLNGSIPDWIKNRDNRYLTNLSYNNFFVQDVPCKETLNLFRSFSGGNLEINKCLGVSPCPKHFKPHSDQRKKIVIVVGAGILLDGTVIAVKQLSSKSKQGNREFVNAIGPKEWQLNLGWPSRLRICIGIARGLAFLHEESRLKIVHRDIKATNVLLDGDLNPKISDFGLAKLTEDDNTHISTRVAGTIGYMAPEYALWGYLTNKVDVYSFGVVALEIAAGKDNMKFRPSDQYVCLLDWALVLQQKGCLMELVDPQLGPDFDKEEAIKMIKIALLCTNPSPALRPAMSAVVSMLEGHLDIQDLVMDPSIYGDEYRFRSLKDKYDELQLQSSNEAQSLIDSMVTTEIGSSSISANDLYQINLDSV